MTLTLRHYDFASGRPVDLPLPLDGPGTACRILLEPATGASAMQVRIVGDGVSLRAEVAVLSGVESGVEWIIDWLASGHLRIDVGPKRQVFFLPGTDEYEPDPLLPGRASGSLDVLFIVDATCRSSAKGQQGRRLDEPDAGGLYPLLADFTRQLLPSYSVARFGVMAFSDEPLTGKASALDLRPGALFQPVCLEGPLPYSTVEELTRGLKSLRSSSGVDWVDAVAEALAWCADWGYWRPDARKLLVLCGDSPGHSVLHPVEAGGDAHARQTTVEEQCRRLHQQGIEIATVFTGPAGDAANVLESSRRITEHARMQYRRLASLSDWAWEEQSFATRAAALLSKPPVWLARGAAYGWNPRQTSATVSDPH